MWPKIEPSEEVKPEVDYMDMEEEPLHNWFKKQRQVLQDILPRIDRRKMWCFSSINCKDSPAKTMEILKWHQIFLFIWYQLATKGLIVQSNTLKFIEILFLTICYKMTNYAHIGKS